MESFNRTMSQSSTPLDEKEIASLVLDHIVDGVITVDRNGIILTFNKGAERMTGFSANDVKGRLYDDVFSENRILYSKLTRTLETGREYQNHKSKIVSEGRALYIMSTTQVLRNEHDEIVGAMVIYRDNTAQELLEDQIRQAEKLAVVGELAAGTAHEIRNPLTSVRGFIQLLDRNLAESMPGKQYFKIILSELDRVNEIIREFLLLSKPTEPNLRKVNVNDILVSTCTLIKSEVMLHNIELHQDMGEEFAIVEVDVEQIKQVFINLLRNSIEAIQSQGKISISVSVTDEQVLIVFSDNGPGISPEQVSRIYEPFFTTKEEGTGLGLTVSYRIIQNHSGGLYVSSKPGEGAIFTVKLPRVVDNA